MKCRVWNVEKRGWVPTDQAAVRILTFDDYRHGGGMQIGPAQSAEVEKISWFSGLHDRTGREIYQGDIFDSDPGFPGSVFPITLENINGFRFMFGRELLNKDTATHGEIIGNIFENPEVLD